MADKVTPHGMHVNPDGTLVGPRFDGFELDPLAISTGPFGAWVDIGLNTPAPNINTVAIALVQVTGFAAVVPDTIQFDVRVVGTPGTLAEATTAIFANEGEHLTLPFVALSWNADGDAVRFQARARSNNARLDGNDFGTYTLLELPLP